MAAVVLLAAVPPAAAPAGTTAVLAGESRPQWARTLDTISQGVVAIQIDLNRAFDTETSTTAQATGFVVDDAIGAGDGMFDIAVSAPLPDIAQDVEQAEIIWL